MDEGRPEMTPAELLLASHVQGYGLPPPQSDDMDDEEAKFMAMLSPATKMKYEVLQQTKKERASLKRSRSLRSSAAGTQDDDEDEEDADVAGPSNRAARVTRGAKKATKATKAAKVPDDLFHLLPEHVLEWIIDMAIAPEPFSPDQSKNSVMAMRAASRFLTTVIDSTNTCIVLGGPSAVKSVKTEVAEEGAQEVEEAVEEPNDALAPNGQAEEVNDEEEEEQEEEEEASQKTDVRKEILPLWVKLFLKSARGITSICVNKKITWSQFTNFVNHPKCKEKLIASIVEINLRGIANTCRPQELSPFTKLTKL